MNRLPEGLAEPLHILEPEPSRWWVWAILLAAVALVCWWLLSRRATEAPLPPPDRVPTEGGLAEAVRALRERARLTRRYRRGCHELALLLRSVLGSADGSLDRLTARELTRRLGDNGRTRLMTLIADARFGRRPPSGDDLEAFCDLALEAFREEAR